MLTFVIWAVLVVVGVLGYLIGSVNPSIIISKCMGTDIREHGSGNAGTTNMLRTYGKRMAIVALLCDVLKGVIAVGLGMFAEHLLLAKIGALHMAGESVSIGASGYFALAFLKYLSGIAVVFGHNYPVFFSFRGGKGIATSAAVILMLDWRTGLVTVIIALLVMTVTRYVSLGSIIAGIVYPTTVTIFVFGIDKNNNLAAVVTSLILGIAAIYRHKANLKRLFSGTESKLGQKTKTENKNGV